MKIRHELGNMYGCAVIVEIDVPVQDGAVSLRDVNACAEAICYARGEVLDGIRGNEKFAVKP